MARGASSRIEALRIELYEKVNALGIGAQGLGGLTTVLDVKIKMYPTHAASKPVAMIPNCAATRHAHFVLDGSGAVALDPPALEDWPKVILYNTGLDFTPVDLWDAAERCNTIERLFNLREGLTRNDLKKGDMLNHRYFDEPCLRGAPGVVGKKIDKEKFIRMVDEFYAFKGLDQNGTPKPETLKRLGLENEPSRNL